MGLCRSRFNRVSTSVNTEKAVAFRIGINALKKSGFAHLLNPESSDNNFGPFKDEIMFGVVLGRPVLYFTGTDRLFGKNGTREYILEWIGNAYQYFNRTGGKKEFHDSIWSALPPSFQDPANPITCVGYSRGGFTMSNFVKYVRPEHVKTCVFIGAPGQLYDCRQKARVYNVWHDRDPICKLENYNEITADVEHGFEGATCIPFQGIRYHIEKRYTKDMEKVLKESQIII